MPNKTLNLPDSPRKLVFRKVVSLLQTNPALKRTVRTWKVFDGTSDEDAAPFATGEMPAVRVLPFAQPATPETPIRQNSPLGIRIEFATEGSNIDDLLDLWGAIESVIFTGDGTQSTLNALRSVYQEVNGVRLSVPAATPNPPDLPNGVLCGVGTLTVDMMAPK